VQLVVIWFVFECVHINDMFGAALWMKFIENPALIIKHEPFVLACCLAHFIHTFFLLYQYIAYSECNFILQDFTLPPWIRL
jgi:hypothetical protein